MAEQPFYEYANERKEYIERLDEAGLLTQDNLIKPEILDTQGIYEQDSPLAKLCERDLGTKPRLCERIATAGEVEQLVEINAEYLDRLEEQELMGVRHLMVELVGWCGTPPGKRPWPFPFPPRRQEEFEAQFEEIMQLEQQFLF